MHVEQVLLASGHFCDENVLELMFRNTCQGLRHVPTLTCHLYSFLI